MQTISEFKMVNGQYQWRRLATLRQQRYGAKAITLGYQTIVIGGYQPISYGTLPTEVWNLSIPYNTLRNPAVYSNNYSHGAALFPVLNTDFCK